MSGIARQAAFFCPAAVSVHNNADMFRQNQFIGHIGTSIQNSGNQISMISFSFSAAIFSIFAMKSSVSF